MPRLAWFTPLPPERSGVARYSVELLPGLSAVHEIDVFVSTQGYAPNPGSVARADPDAPLVEGGAIFSAHDFVWKHARHPYDLIVYQLGNAPCHNYMWAYLVRYPGLVVLHDGQLHQARALWLRAQKRFDDYRAEFAFSHPDVTADVAELGSAGMLGSLHFLFPMRALAVSAARLVVVHNHWLAAQIAEEQPDARITTIDMGVPAPTSGAAAGATIRARHGIPADGVVFVGFGRATPEKRVFQSIRALASIAGTVANVHLLLAGETVDYCDALAEARALGIEDRVTVAGFVPDAELDAYLSASDVCLCLRWPTSRETSAAWLRCLAAGKPTIITDLVHTTGVPSLDPRDWSVLYVPTPADPEDEQAASGVQTAASTLDAVGASDREPACVAIDILDEDHSLRLAMRRLATDVRLRAALGQRARALWMERFTLDRMVSGYLKTIETACAVPAGETAHRRATLPPHFFTDGTEHASALMREMGLSEARIADVWSRR